ncbi:MAG: DUF6305 family protein [Acidobacteriota bacterium]
MMARSAWAAMAMDVRAIGRTAMIVAACAVCAGHDVAAQAPVKAKLPLVITSCGQSPDAYTVSMLAKRIKLEHTFDNVLKPDALKPGSTLVVVMGGSAKGLGEAGIDEKGEIARVAALLAKAKDLKMTVVGAHIGGESRRGPLSDKFIDPVAARADYFVVTQDGNKDGLFSNLSKSRGVPLVVVKQLVDVGKELKALFPAQ